MSSPAQTDEDEVDDVEDVEFVSDGPVRPVMDCIDLLSDSEDEGCSSFAGTTEDKITRQKARVTSTLDKLAQQVALQKKERADKCRAFKEKQISQRARGQQELAVAHGVNQEAKRCVDLWLKMPGLQPGVVSAGARGRHRSASFPRNSSTRHTCPVINCGRVYENPSLLDGHLKRFDHSPCDPAINLKGNPSERFACVACGQNFQTKEAWRKHLETKVSSPAADAHVITQTYQRIVCFACPACSLLFSLRDECLQHMSAQNHFAEALTMNAKEARGGRALPVPVPQYVKNRLIALCKDTEFRVRCSLCHKVLISHQVAQAHFNVSCRQGCAVAKADKTILQVMKQLQVRGQCSLCCQIFLSQAEIERHQESTQHDVEVNQTIEKALLQHCRFGQVQHSPMAKEGRGVLPFQKRIRKKGEFEKSPAKRQRRGLSEDDSTTSATAWYCECGQPFPEEALASKHLLAVNQIFHQCGVCDKLMGEPSITRLHMSRFHGGAHLSNFLFYCRKCKVEMPRYEDILSHVSDTHSGHTYFAEQEVSEEVATVIHAKPSTSHNVPLSSSSAATEAPSSSSRAEQSWMCRMCEDTFDSEAAVREHCGDLSSHSFQRFVCGHCPQKFFKESTVRRHCANEHDGLIQSSHFCGLCDSMQFETEGEFFAHYESLHSKDYYCMSDGSDAAQPAVAESGSLPACPCMSSEKSKETMKATYTHCMRNLATEGRCQYVCAPCDVTVPSFAQMKTHVHTKHAALHLDKTFEVRCEACTETFAGVPGFHSHYHARHCALEPCVSSRTGGKQPATVKKLSAAEIKPGDRVIAADSDEEMKNALSIEEAAREKAEIEETLQRSLLEF